MQSSKSSSTVPACALDSVLSPVAQGLRNYFRKFLGIGAGPFPPRPPLHCIFWSWVGTFTGIGCLLGTLNYFVGFPQLDDAIIGSFGAVAILSYGAYDSPFAQPRNVFVAHAFSAIIGVAFNVLLSAKWVAGGCAVAFSLSVMQLTRTIHPPAGATALIAVLSDVQTFHYVLWPVEFGILMITIVAIIVNNIPRQYPLYWLYPNQSKKPTVGDGKPLTNGVTASMSPPHSGHHHLTTIQLSELVRSCTCDCVCACRALHSAHTVHSISALIAAAHSDHCPHHSHHHTPCLNDGKAEVIVVRVPASPRASNAVAGSAHHPFVFPHLNGIAVTNGLSHVIPGTIIDSAAAPEVGQGVHIEPSDVVPPAEELDHPRSGGDGAFVGRDGLTTDSVVLDGSAPLETTRDECVIRVSDCFQPLTTDKSVLQPSPSSGAPSYYVSARHPSLSLYEPALDCPTLEEKQTETEVSPQSNDHH